MDHSQATGSMFITGVSSGIGRATAQHFIKKPMHVSCGVENDKITLTDEQGWLVLGTVLNKEELQEARASLPGIAAHVVDVREEATIQEAARSIGEELGSRGLDVLVNCAGVASCAPLELTTTEEFQAVFGVNVFGSAAVTRHFLPLLRMSLTSPQGGRSDFRRLHAPRIINMSSLVGRIAIPWASVYSASKHAVEALSDALRLELAPQGIRVAVIEPGFVKTGLPGAMWRGAQRTLEDSRPGPRSVYEEPFLKGVEVMQGMAEHLDIPVSSVVATIERAVLATSPCSRYSLDANVSLFILLRTRLLPDWLWDTLWPWAERLQVWMIKRAAAAKRKQLKK